ncbi:hypothetical protein BKA56DRAFT_278688 [Ilyonectria sp. MPI-CAGE-AT-0026]|nr:hypothetical protein BKA56DRAFT_278688 [Ilyonectria sp. MPI-CAGE-AT-0026]
MCRRLLNISLSTGDAHVSCLVTAISPFVGITWHVTIINPRPSRRRQHNAVQLYVLGAACQKQPMQYLQYHPPQTLLTDASVTMPLTILRSASVHVTRRCGLCWFLLSGALASSLHLVHLVGSAQPG